MSLISFGRVELDGFWKIASFDDPNDERFRVDVVTEEEVECSERSGWTWFARGHVVLGRYRFVKVGSDLVSRALSDTCMQKYV